MTKGTKTTSVNPVAIDPMVELLRDKINTLDPTLIPLQDINDNLTIDQLLELVAIATNNKKHRDQLLADISVLTTNKKLLGSMDDMTTEKLEEVLENLRDPVFIKINRAVKQEAINYTDYQPSKTVDAMLCIQGQKTDQQLLEDPIDCVIGSVFIKIGNLKEQYFCEVFKTSIVLSDNSHQLGLTAKQLKLLSNEVGSLWCYANKQKRLVTKQANETKRQADLELMKQNMIDAIRRK